MKRIAPSFLVISLVLTLSTACFTRQKTINQALDLRRVGEAYMDRGNFSEALSNFLKAEDLLEKDHILQDDLGKAYVAKQKYDLAIKHFKRCIEIDPTYAPGKNNLGSAYLLAGKWDDAINVFNELTDNLLYATPQFPIYNLGWAYYNKKDYKKAIEYYEKALKIQHGYVLALRGIGLCWVKQGRMDKALEYFQKATEKSPKFPDLYMDLGDAYAACSNTLKAIEAYNEVIHIQPDSDMADQAKGRITDLNQKK